MAALIELTAVEKSFPAARTLGQALRRQHPVVRAVDGINLGVGRGESVGLVGESGSGKTTVGRLMLKLAAPTAGQVRFDGEDLAAMGRARTKHFRQQAQLVFQNPFDAVNPRFTIRRAIAEPLVNTGVPQQEHEDRIVESLKRVRLGDIRRTLGKHPRELSGGQLQRVVLARALVVRPIFLVADEPVSMLDVSVRAGVLNLMRDLRDTLDLTALYISHDLTLVRHVCERTLVMYLGRVVEDGPTAEVINRPAHPYTRALVQAVPRPRTDQSRAALPISTGQSGGAPTSGCRLRDRCPHAFDRCAAELPVLTPVAAGHSVACHLLGSGTKQF